MGDEISVSVESYVEPAINQLRYRWSLQQVREADVPSPQTFATRREAKLAADVALERAIHRGNIR